MSTIQITKPTLGRIVIFTAWRGEGEASGSVDEYAGLVVGVSQADRGLVDLKTFGPNSIYSNSAVPFDAKGSAGTWRYPPQYKDVLDLDTDGRVVGPEAT